MPVEEADPDPATSVLVVLDEELLPFDFEDFDLPEFEGEGFDEPEERDEPDESLELDEDGLLPCEGFFGADEELEPSERCLPPGPRDCFPLLLEELSLEEEAALEPLALLALSEDAFESADAALPESELLALVALELLSAFELAALADSAEVWPACSAVACFSWAATMLERSASCTVCCTLAMANASSSTNTVNAVSANEAAITQAFFRRFGEWGAGLSGFGAIPSPGVPLSESLSLPKLPLSAMKLSLPVGETCSVLASVVSSTVSDAIPGTVSDVVSCVVPDISRAPACS